MDYTQDKPKRKQAPLDLRWYWRIFGGLVLVLFVTLPY